MKKWAAPVVEELTIDKTASQGNNKTKNHKGYCEMHKHPENGICTCGAIDNAPEFVDHLS